MGSEPSGKLLEATDASVVEEEGQAALVEAGMRIVVAHPRRWVRVLLPLASVVDQHVVEPPAGVGLVPPELEL